MRRRSSISLTIALLVLLAVPIAARAGQHNATEFKVRPAMYGISTTRDVPIEMSDGVTLRANVVRPADDDGSPAKGRFPVILTQTPYNKNSPGLSFESDFLVQRGYVQVIADVRGTGSSEGNWDSFGAREDRDGGELAAWTTKQPWSNGDVGLFGTSYGAINQFFTAASQNPAIKAMFPIVPMSDAYRDITVSGGQVNTSFIPSWLGLVTGTSSVPALYAPTDPAGAAQVLAQHVANVTRFQAPVVASGTTGGTNAFDGPFYRTRSPIEVIDRVHVPTFIVGGWFDLFQRGEPFLFQTLQEQGVPVRLLMGPWYHTDPSLTGDADLTAHGLPTLEQLELQWFDHYMLGKPMPIVRGLAPATYFRIGADAFDSTSTWPPPDASFRQLYLSGPAAPGNPGLLTLTAPKTQAPDAVPWNPASGACTRSTVQWTAGDGKGSPCETNNAANDQSGIAYDLSLQDAPIDLAGPIAAHLYVSTTAKDAFLTVRVEDVSAGGSNSTQLSAGWQVLSLRALDPTKTVRSDGLIIRPYHPFTKKSMLPVESGTIYEVWVEIFPTAATVAKGDTLRISITPSDAPHLSPPLPQFANEAGGMLSVYHDAKHPSAVVVPEQP
ncbi:MAG: CocE/NonD family hydrolase [Actinomycetota bacterium]